MPRVKKIVHQRRSLMDQNRFRSIYNIQNTAQYVLAVLLVGESELPMREFLLLNGILPPTKYSFYAAQRYISAGIHQCVMQSINKARSEIQNGDNLSYDASWGSKRQSLNCIVEMMSKKNKKNC